VKFVCGDRERKSDVSHDFVMEDAPTKTFEEILHETEMMCAADAELERKAMLLQFEG